MTINLKNRKKLYLLVFIEGFTVLALQILTSVAITPFWGNTFMFWSLSLFFTMIALSLGYYLAPRLNEKTIKIENLLVRILWISYCYILLLFFFSDKILNYLILIISSPVIGIIASLFLFIFIPVALLATLPILIISYHKSKFAVNESEIAGVVFSISSASGILAVVFLSFVLLPFTGLKYSLIIVLLLLFLLHIYILNYFKRRSILLVLCGITVVALILLYAQEKKTKRSFSEKGLIRTKEIQQGIFGEIKVVENYSQETKLLFVNNVPQSKAHFTGRSLYSYVYSLSMYASFKPAGSKVLLAGMGAGNLVYELSQLNFDLDVVDIDPRLLDIAKRNFVLPEKKFNFFESDIRRFVKKSKNKYDVIILDLSIGESVPTNVYTLESFKECKKLLNETGIILIHFLSSMSYDGKLALTSIGKTLRESGMKYKIMNRLNQKNILDGIENLEKPDSYIFIAGSNIDLSGATFIMPPGIPEKLTPEKNNLFLEFDDGDGLILSDDKPILDILQTQNAINLRKENIETMRKKIQNEK